MGQGIELYDAFISYSRHDIRAAVWLQDYIQTRKIPKKIRNATGLKRKTLDRVCRDESDFSAEHRLNEAIEKKLQKSAFLLVLCSPYSVASDYVGAEIRYFQSLGKADRILCVIVGGEPSNTSKLRCFPPAITAMSGEESEAELPLAADLRSGSGGFSPTEGDKIVAGILGVSLRDIHHSDYYAKKLRIGLVAGLLFTTCAVAMFIWDGWYRHNLEYYRHFMPLAYGKLEAVGQLTKEQASKRQAVYHVTTQGRYGLIINVELKKGLSKTGRPEYSLTSLLGNSLTRECHAQGAFFVAAQYSRGQLSEIKWLNPNGFELEKVIFLESSSNAEFRELAFSCSKAASGIRYINFQYQPDQNRIRSGFLNEKREKAPNHDGVYAIEYQLDDRNLIVTKLFYDQNGNNQETQSGIHKAVFERDQAGELISRTTFGKNGEPSGRCHKVMYEHDLVGNVIRESCVGADQEPNLDYQWVATYQHKYDNSGNLIETQHLDTNGEATFSNRWVSKYAFEYDLSGNRVKTSSFGKNKEPVFAKDGTMVDVFEHDVNGNTVAHNHFDAFGSKIFDTAYFHHRHVYKLDSFGRTIESRSYGLQGDFIYDAYGIAYSKYDWNRDNHRSNARYYSPTRELTYSDDGYAGWDVEHDETGNEIKSLYVGVDNKRALRKEGYSGSSKDFDEHGNMVSIEYLGNTDQSISPQSIGSSVLSQKGEYDDKGRVIKITNYDGNGNIVADNNGVAVSTNEYDTNGNLIRRLYFDAHNRPVLSNQGFSEWLSDYDGRDLLIKQSFFGIDGEPVLLEDEIHSEINIYDERGLLIENRYFGSKNQPTSETRDSNIHAHIRNYDERGRLVKLDYLDINNQFTTNNESVATIKFAYDDRNNQVSWKSFGLEGQKIIDSSGFHEIKDEYDNRSRHLRRAYYNVSGEPVLSEFGYAGRQQYYNERHQEIKRVYFGLNDEPVLAKFEEPHRAIEVRNFNRDGQLVYELYYDQNLITVEREPGVYGSVNEYNANGDKVGEVLLDRAEMEALGLLSLKLNEGG